METGVLSEFADDAKFLENSNGSIRGAGEKAKNIFESRGKMV